MSDNLPEKPETSVLESELAAPERAVIERAPLLRQTFQALAYKDYRYLWIGALLSNSGTWLQTVALGWLVLTTTNSAFLLGLVNFSGTLPIFFLALFAGSAADRLNRKNLLIASQVAMMILAFALGALASADLASIPAILLITLGAGVALAFNFPAWLAVIPDLVPRKHLLNAIALNSAQFNAARFIGPAIAGLVLASLGIPATFYLNGVSFLAVIFALLIIKPKSEPIEPQNGSVWAHFLEGVRYAWSHTNIGVLLLSIAIINVFGMSFTALMPIFARDVLGVGERGLGFLFASTGLGAFVGALAVAYLAHVLRKPPLIKLGILVFSLSLFIFAISRSPILSYLALVLIGVSFLAAVSSINTALQSSVPNAIRGRIMSLFVWAFLGLQPFGSILFGSVAHVLSAPTAVALGSGVCLIAALLLFFRPQLLRGVD